MGDDRLTDPRFLELAPTDQKEFMALTYDYILEIESEISKGNELDSSGPRRTAARGILHPPGGVAPGAVLDSPERVVPRERTKCRGPGERSGCSRILWPLAMGRHRARGFAIP